MDLTEPEDINKRWQEYTEEEEKRKEYEEKLCKKDLNDPDNHDGVITHPEPHPGMRSQVSLRKHHYKQS